MIFQKAKDHFNALSLLTKAGFERKHLKFTRVGTLANEITDPGSNSQPKEFKS